LRNRDLGLITPETLLHRALGVAYYRDLFAGREPKIVDFSFPPEDLTLGSQGKRHLKSILNSGAGFFNEVARLSQYSFSRLVVEGYKYVHKATFAIKGWEIEEVPQYLNMGWSDSWSITDEKIIRDSDVKEVFRPDLMSGTVRDAVLSNTILDLPYAIKQQLHRIGESDNFIVAEYAALRERRDEIDTIILVSRDAALLRRLRAYRHPKFISKPSSFVLAHPALFNTGMSTWMCDEKRWGRYEVLTDPGSMRHYDYAFATLADEIMMSLGMEFDPGATQIRGPVDQGLTPIYHELMYGAQTLSEEKGMESAYR